jgi:lipoprotein-anchoring transpeptidase ErfK/SrfK
VKLRLPMRPNGRTGWVPRDALAELNVVRKYIDVDKRRLRVRLYDRGKVVFRARVGVGKAGTPTPSGTYYIREKFKVRGVPLYGTHAIGTSAYAPTLSDWPGGGVVGLHGTNQPGLIPGRPSHGCMRLKNRDIARLYRLAPRGTPIHIH